MGAEVTRTAHFLGRHIDYVLGVTAHEPPTLPGMTAAGAAVPTQISCPFEAHPRGALAGIRVRGDPGGFLRATAPLMSHQVRPDLTKCLRTLECGRIDREGGT